MDCIFDYSILEEEVWPISGSCLCTGQEEHALKLLVISTSIAASPVLVVSA